MKLTTKAKRATVDYTLRYINERFNKTPDYIMGIDLSLSSTGVVILDSDMNIVHHEAVETSTADGAYKYRCKKIYDLLSKVVNKYQPKLIGYEQINVYKNVQAAHALSLVKGQLYSVLDGSDLLDAFIIPMTTSQIKKIGRGVGTGDKNLMLKDVLVRFGENFDSDDEADAYCAAVGACAILDIARAYVGYGISEDVDEINSFILDFEKVRNGEAIELANRWPDGVFETCLSICESNTRGKSMILMENDYTSYMDSRDTAQEVMDE